MPSAALDAVITALAERSDVDKDVSGAEVRAVVGEIWTPGRLPVGSTAWSVSSAGMDITVGSPDDAAVVRNAGSGRLRDAFLVKQTAPATVTLDQSLATQARTDQIWLVVKQNALDATGSTEAAIEVRTGAGGSSTAPADDPDPAWVSAIRIADVRVPAGASAPSSITRRIADAQVRARDAFDLRYARTDVNGRLGRHAAPSVFDRPASLPSGMTWTSVDRDDGWPYNGTLLTMRHNDDRTGQLLLSRDGARILQRSHDSPSGAWSDWLELGPPVATIVTAEAYELDTVAGADSGNGDRIVSAPISIPDDWNTYRLEVHATYRVTLDDGELPTSAKAFLLADGAFFRPSASANHQFAPGTDRFEHLSHAKVLTYKVSSVEFEFDASPGSQIATSDVSIHATAMKVS